MPKCTITPRFVKHGTPTPVDAGIEVWPVTVIVSDNTSEIDAGSGIRLVITKVDGGAIKAKLDIESAKLLVTDINRLILTEKIDRLTQ